ncbi:polyketide cyclase / dehydrase and lipid transport [Amycolatopsis sp. NPDC051716]|uniref:polyketide cyclase / dehydrase and lipid transport n=1 Tax=Amycolatopsis sp. NPDC051716 TaxID=3155804 RepID=UPI003431A888
MNAPPSLDIVDETFLAVPPATVAAVFAEPASWRRYWPDLVLEVYTDRGDKGLRWTVTGALVGTMEVWLEPVLDGTLLHYFLRATPADAAGTPRELAPRDLRREFDRRARAAKANALGLKEILEDGREPGVPPRGEGSDVES